jgi:hypothetical protein
MGNGRTIQGVWLIERSTGRNIVSRAYSGIEIDMDLIAPFLSATHTFIDKASSEQLQTIDTEHNRYVWLASEYLLFVLVCSKSTRIAHMRFILEYLLDEFMRNEVPKNSDVDTLLKTWWGAPDTFSGFGEFIDVLVGQYEATDEVLVASKSIDCLEVYNHLFRAIMCVKADKDKRKAIVKSVKKKIKPLIEKYPFLAEAPIDGAGIEVLDIKINPMAECPPYRQLRIALEDLLGILTSTVKEIVGTNAYRAMIFNELIGYLRRDLDRLDTYKILDDIIRHVF